MVVTIILTDDKGNNVQDAVANRLHSILSKAIRSGKPMQEGIVDSVRTHFSNRWPGSRHYNPEKVQPTKYSDEENPTAEVSIDVPGVTRAYHNMNILPRFRKHLAIPMHQLAFGKKPSDFSNAFVVTKKNGNKFLAQRHDQGIIFLFNLVKSAFQRRDPSIMPSDETIADKAFSRIIAYLAPEN